MGITLSEVGVFRTWLASQAEARYVPLFETHERRVSTFERGKSRKRTLKRSTAMEMAMIEVVEAGLRQDDWNGILYVMGWGPLDAYRPLYIGKANKRGKKGNISANLKNVRSDSAKFARWGYGNAYHVGDLSQALFRWESPATGGDMPCFVLDLAMFLALPTLF